MVKNIKGGSGHKKFARKHTNISKSNKLRVSIDEGEIYAIVTKILGNGMFHCHCIDGKLRLGHIRGKFTGRGKRDNIVEGGKWVLVGLREWDISSNKSTISKEHDKIQKCDLLEVYSDTDKQLLKESVIENWNILDTNDISNIKFGETKTVDDDFIFGTDRDFERERLIEEMKSTSEKVTLEIEETKNSLEEEINFDDI